MPKPTLLFIISPDFDASSTATTVIKEILRCHEQDVNIHLASYNDENIKWPEEVTFHTLPGKSYHRKYLDSKDYDLWYPERSSSAKRSWINLPNDPELLKRITKRMELLLFSDPEEYVKTGMAVERLIFLLEPTFIVVDPGFSPARDACHRLKRAVCILSAGMASRNIKNTDFWDMLKVPTLATTYTSLLSWYQIPFNLIQGGHAMDKLITSNPTTQAFLKARTEAGYSGPLMSSLRGEESLICASTPAIEYSFKMPPEQAKVLTCVGPILQNWAPLAESYPEYAAWVAQRPTIVVSVSGQTFPLSRMYAENVWFAIRAVLQHRPDVQVWWRLMEHDDIAETQGEKEFDGRMKITRTVPHNVKETTGMILRTGNAICVVRRGGSDLLASEALADAVPSVVLEADGKMDGLRIQMDGTGVWGNVQNAPRCDGSELASSIFAVIGQRPGAGESGKFRQRSAECARIIKRMNGGKPGREAAAEEIWRQLKAEMGKTGESGTIKPTHSQQTLFEVNEKGEKESLI